MARELKAKEPKKKGRRLKKSIRKTLGTLCLISAILVATIPTEGLKQVSADEPGGNSKLNEEQMKGYYKVPDLSKYKGKIYTTGNGEFQFAYVTPDGSDTGPSKIAVILGYSNVGALENGTLRIPDTVDAYLNYLTTDGTGQGYVAVGQSGNYLFYRRLDQTIPAEHDVSGNVTKEEEHIYSYHPCYYNDYASWGDTDSSELYYYDTDDFKPAEGVEPKVVGTTESYMRIKDAMVTYIGNQYLVSDDAGGWSIGGNVDAEHGIFASKGSIVNLVVGNNLSGIGNYAFYSCTSMRSITLSNALDTIGNYAFADCYNMNTVNLNPASNITAIGTHAFENCRALTSFTVPVNVTAIGDAAFKGCWSLSEIDLCGGGQNVALNTLGCDLFVDCQQLKSLTFPKGFTEDVDISNFEGCLSLGSITVGNKTMNITENFGKATGTPAFGYEDFKRQYNDSTVVHGTFYFEGPTNSSNPSNLHKTAMKYYFAFSYLNEADLEPQDIYELTMETGGKKAIYRVNSADTLIETVLDDGIENIVLPEYIGPNYINTIGPGVFQNYCSVKELTIPSTVMQINEDAFSGCHNLQYVTFDDPTNLKIDDGAFQTQKIVGGHKCGQNLPTEPKMTFIGPISLDSAPFLYAMEKNNKISVGSQKDSYITYFSGWPSGLVVEYNPETDKNELKDYPTLGDLESASSSTMSEIYSAIDKDLAGEYQSAMLGAYQKLASKSNSEAVTGYESRIWDSVMNIVLPAGIEGIEAGLFKEKEVDSGENANPYFSAEGAAYKTLSAYGLKEVLGDDDPDDGEDTGCFADCDNFGSISLYGETESIGDYAFKGCSHLQRVTVPDTVTEIGRIPFTGCSRLSDVNFQGSQNFSCDNSIIYQLDSSGNKYRLVEMLEGRASGNVSATEVSGINEIAEEAFSGTKASFVDLSGTNVERIPEKAFANCEKLVSVVLPDSLKSVANQAFMKCPGLQRMEVPSMTTIFYNDAVDTSGTDRPEDLVFVCNEESLAAEYAREYDFAVDPNGMAQRYKVTWEDWDGTELKVEYVVQGMDATPPKAPDYPDPSEPGHRPGYDFVGWNKDYQGVSGELNITAVYETTDPDTNKVWVYFYDEDRKTELADPVHVTIGDLVKRPADPMKAGYAFIGWIGDADFDTPIVRDTYFYAQWERLDNRYVVRFINDNGALINQQLVNPGEDAYEPKTPTPALAEHSGWTFAGWIPADFTKVTKDLDIYATYTNGSVVSGGGSGNGSGVDGTGGNGSGGTGGNGSGGNVSGGDSAGGNDSGNTISTLYTLTVQNGSGSGSYVAGSQPVIVASDPPSGQEFSNWTIDPADTKIASTVLSATVITMPETNVTVTAHYKEKTGTGTGSGNSNNNNSNRPNGNSGAVSSGTTVVIDKNGLSNTGVVSATVRGSSDNFTIKVTESTAASEAIVKALQAEYGDNISNIKYFPMDISLYDSTGTKKITDTTGLSVTITLPLPDSLITYAGNNKVAGVVNNRLDKLSPKFTTIDKVACVTFTAEHFSPYVIYVETNNLSEGTVVDSTPKTGDGIHPKWFLSIGLACVSVVLFMKKDKRSLTAKAA